ncbi:MAG: hypothetical protein QJR04_12660 [Burkholderia multivorans]|nr:hypothetical protein [Burkholderia multivorans]
MLQTVQRASRHLRRYFSSIGPPFEAYFDATDMAEIANIRAELT